MGKYYIYYEWLQVVTSSKSPTGFPEGLLVCSLSVCHITGLFSVMLYWIWNLMALKKIRQQK